MGSSRVIKKRKHNMNFEKKILFLFLLVTCTISEGKGSRIKCYTGVKGSNGNAHDEVKKLEEKTCDEGVSQCSKAFGSLMGASGHTYSCGSKDVLPNGCTEVEQNILGTTIKAKSCVCTGNLCNSTVGKSINFMVLFFCLMLFLF